ncbi:hypothetical protein M427DRAFT_42218 [Gonapodya prolifera JEL478]|uniref:Uncharacterized protein n=1 Tax=Gonapodya prolifera (strain JEL478) TaxID=1344416 RepID=A0A139AQC8_GONPJ|nr:hypothetical protein M427DRAFT_42218 [Gonapodya prolifera JEL478]|eukprot:KXS18971.1 hypothetical protein M427DRAFT_42218 [Gonapodya prolifera JEL478]
MRNIIDLGVEDSNRFVHARHRVSAALDEILCVLQAEFAAFGLAQTRKLRMSCAFALSGVRVDDEEKWQFLLRELNKFEGCFQALVTKYNLTEQDEGEESQTGFAATA